MPIDPGSNLTRRNRLAQMLMQQEQSAQPIQSHTQGLASMLRQGLAGYMQGADARDRSKAYETMVQGLQSGGGLAGAEKALSGMAGNEYAQQMLPDLAMQRIAREQQLADQASQFEMQKDLYKTKLANDLPAGMRQGPNGPEWVPGYVEGQSKIYGMRAAAQAAAPMNPLQQSQYEEAQRKAQNSQADRVAQGEAALFDIDRTIRSAEELIQHPGREMATGASSFMSAVPGSDARGFAAKLETLQSQVFLPEVQKMVGMGALSNAEGQKLASAFASLDPSMPEAEFLQQLNQAIGDMQSARARMGKKFGLSSGAGSIPQSAPAAAHGSGAAEYDYDPATGQLVPRGQ